MRPSRVVKEFVACVGRGLESISLRWDMAALPFSKSHVVSCEGGCGKGFLAHTMSNSLSSQFFTAHSLPTIPTLRDPPLQNLFHSRRTPHNPPLFPQAIRPTSNHPFPNPRSTRFLPQFCSPRAGPSPNCPCAFRPVHANRHNTHAHSGRQIFGGRSSIWR